MRLSAERTLRWITDNSIIFAMKTVQVMSDANARPIITAFTTTSADMNIDHGDNSFGTEITSFEIASAAAVDVAGGGAAWVAGVASV